MASGNAVEARISDGRTCSATKNEIGSINAARAGPSAPLTVVDDEGDEGRRGRRGWAGKSVCTRARGRERDRVYSRGAGNERDGGTTNPRLRHV